MPPCAATVWLRVGNTLVMHAVDRPESRQAERRAQAGAAGADDDDVVGVIDELDKRSCRHAPNAMRSTAKIAERGDARTCSESEQQHAWRSSARGDARSPRRRPARRAASDRRACRCSSSSSTALTGAAIHATTSCVARRSACAAATITNHNAEQKQRDRRHALRPPVRPPSFAEPRPSTRPSGLRRLMRHLRRAQDQDPEQRRGATIAPRNTIQPLSARDLALEAVARVPGQVPHAVQQVIEECEREADQQRRCTSGCAKNAARLRVGLRPLASGDQPVHEQQQADRQRAAGHAMQDRQGHRVLPAVHAEKRRQRPSDVCSCCPSCTPDAAIAHFRNRCSGRSFPNRR